MATISLCMMVRNEARFLGACLASARAAADEVLVLDTGSTDGTQAIARSAGAAVRERAWNDDFAAMRNASIEGATGDFILVLDGDEALDDGAVEAIRALDLSDAGPDAFRFEVVNYTSDAVRAQESNVFHQVRLFRRRPEHRYQGVVHNQLVDTRSGVPLDGPAVPIRVHHFGYVPSVWKAQNKADRLALLERVVAQQPERALAHYNLANHLKILGRHEEALAEYLVVVERAALPSAAEYVQSAFFSAAFCANKVGRPALAVSLCERLLVHEPSLADAHLRRAEALLELGRNLDVADGLSALLADPNRYAVKRYSLDFGVPYRLGQALFNLGRHAEAAPFFGALAEGGTDDVTVFTHLAVCRAALGDLAGAVRALDDGAAIAPDDPDVAQLRQGLESPEGRAAAAEAAWRTVVADKVAAGDVAGAIALLQQVLDRAPSDAGAHNDLAVLLHRQGRTDRARQHLLYASDAAPRDLQTLQNLLEVCIGTAHEAEALARVERSLATAVAAQGGRAEDPVYALRTSAPLRVLLVGEGAAGLCDLLAAHTPHRAAELAPGETRLPEFDVLHIAGPLDAWPGIDWPSVVRRAPTVAVDEGGRLSPPPLDGMLRVDASYPPAGLPGGPRVEPVYDAHDVVPVTPAAPLRIYHEGPEAAPERQALRAAVAGLPVGLELCDEFDADALRRCHGVWRPASPPLLLTAMALGQVVLTSPTPAEAVLWPDRPVVPDTRESLAALAEDTSLSLAFRIGRAGRRWVLHTHSPARVAAGLSALYAYAAAR